MKALVIADRDAPVVAIARYLEPAGFDMIRYRSAVKALDNIEEIAPDAVFISAGDFPRHWKAIVQFIRADTGKDRTVVVLLASDRFTEDDADKALHIGVQAIVGEDLSGANDDKKLFDIFSRYRYLGPRPALAHGEAIERAVLVFTNPETGTIITGKVDALSENEIRFRPDAPSATAELAAGEMIDSCSLKIADRILSPSCRIVRNGYVMSLAIADISNDDKQVLQEFISETE